ncbi:MAG: ABC transporter permease [Dysgonamonadaceae bacterium]|jgi:putative ABC transport system permease protein|nr:ABC transporter permease [Dysgonamonadaceae bacterium]
MKNFFDIDRWQEIWITITHNKSRSVLTAFGVFWGMFMLVLMVGAGNSLEKGIKSEIDGFAVNSCFFWAQRTTMPYKGFQKGRSWDIRNNDIKVIRQRVPELQYLSPMLFGGNTSEQNNTVRGEYGGSFGLNGCYPEANEIQTSRMIFGRYINDIDIEDKRKVCVIGERVYEVLFPKKEDPLGSIIRINGIYFQVVGVSQALSSASIGGDPKTTITLPFTTMQQTFNQGDVVHFVAATAKPGVKMKIVEDKIVAVLSDLHQIAPDDKEGVGRVNIEDQFMMFNNLGLGITALIWLVGLGTLFAGAIGISNIMLVTVRERTKEIGVRRALGATPGNIVGQILTESIVLTILAGIGGIMISVGILSAVGVALSQGDQFFKDPQISFMMGVGALLILAVIGTLAGFIPAQRAMMIKPIEAIREE